ncbi:conserved hypothetical protein [Gloeothece citriformis PCC 7424]|uniref:Uncharacterized protein n=1 Tax=Gloeothece citriformis (strain PCC 7424) TaxID=65393 RepID=B7KJY6_GLOC7|nr:hemolysin XhlA family protein [Gloeothece citriformis]ACK69585.1 conserved hypothetical protein [Gloeothece citriformis PCC 7424]
MSNTPLTVQTDLGKILERIEGKIDNLQKDITDLKVDMATVKTKLEGLEKRMDNQEFLSRGVLIGLMVAIIGGFVKLFGWVGNP